MKLKLLLFFIIIHRVSFGQVNVDSLVQAAKNSNNDSLKISIYNDLCWDLMRQSADSALEFGQKALKLSESTKNREGEAKAWNNMAIVYWVQGNYQKAIELLTTANEIYSTIEHQRGISVTYVNIGILEMNLSRYNDAVLSLNKALAIQDELKDSATIAAIKTNLGNIFIELQDFSKAKDLYIEAYRIKSATKHPTTYLTETNLGVAYKMLEMMDSALYFFEEAYKKSEHDPYNRGDNLTNIATVWRDRGVYDKAETALKEALTINTKHPNAHKRVYMLNNLATVYLKAKKNIEQIPLLLTESSLISDSLRNYSRLENCYGHWMSYYKYIGDLDGYVKSAEKFQLAKDSLFSEKMRKSIQELEVKYETERKERKLLAQSLELQTQQASLFEKKNQLIGLGSFVFFLLIAGGGGFYTFKQRQHKITQQAVIEEQKRGIKAVFDATEEERKRIAKDLHDGLGQQLSGIKMAFQNLVESSTEKWADSKEQVNKILTIMDESATEVRAISHQMMPRSLMELGLVPAMSDSLEKYLGAGSIEYEFDHQGVDERLEERIEVSIYRVFQELLNNIIKHSSANKVSVQLIKNAGKLILTVEDNGRGFNGNSNTGMGMWSIKNRLDLILGRISYEQNTDNGTVAIIVIPLKDA